jgi:hypothetical protein
MRQGGVTNRPGTVFVAEVKDSSKTVRLIPFTFNRSQSYVLEFGNLYMRVHKNGTPVRLTGQNITAISNASPGVLTYDGADTYANGDDIYISGIVGAIGTYLNGRTFRVANVNTGANTFELNYIDGTAVNTTSMGSYTSGGTIAEVFTLTTTYVEADLSSLSFTQSADVLTIAHPTYPVREVARVSETSWTIANKTFGSAQAAPTNPANTGGAGTVTHWKITAVASDTREESAPTSATSTTSTPSVGGEITVSWTSASGAQEYNVYKATINSASQYGYIGTTTGTAFVDNGITPDFSLQPPVAKTPFGSADNYPSAVTYAQQRLFFANTNNDPEKIWGSRVGQFTNYDVSSPLQDDDALTFVIASTTVNAVRHLVDIGKLIVFTDAGEWTVGGGTGDILAPTTINPTQHSYNGASSLRPIVVDSTALYVQSRGSIVRDFDFDFSSDGYKGSDLTTFSTHLFDGYTLSDWTYQKTPNSTLWAVRSDGKLLGLTYIREQNIVGWHRHDFDGTIENVCAIPEGSEDRLYCVIKRTINGATHRYVERFASRLITDIKDAIFLDCEASYDGRNTGSTSMTISGGTNWTYDETLTLTASASTFASTNVGDEVHITGSDGTIIRFTITGYTGVTVVTGHPHKTVPASMRSTAITDWALAVDSLTGLWHLEGEQVSILADGFVAANPNNEAYTTVTVANGSITLDRPYGVIRVGLPYLSDVETLDIDTVDAETLVDREKNITDVSIFVESSRGIWIGPQPPSDDDDDPLENLYEAKVRFNETYDEPVDLKTEKIKVNIASQYNSNGRVFIRQVDPLPLSILSIAPSGLIPFRKKGS